MMWRNASCLIEIDHVRKFLIDTNHKVACLSFCKYYIRTCMQGYESKLVWYYAHQFYFSIIVIILLLLLLLLLLLSWRAYGVSNLVKWRLCLEFPTILFLTLSLLDLWICRLKALYYSLRKHVYLNILKISQPKTVIFLDKNSNIFFSSFCSKIDRGYSLGVYRAYIISVFASQKHKLWVHLRTARQGGSNQYPQFMFWA